MTGALEPAPVAGTVLCGATAADCRCREPAGHYPATPHACPPPCGGSWRGTDGAPDFEIVQLPGGGTFLGALLVSLLGGRYSDDPDW